MAGHGRESGKENKRISTSIAARSHLIPARTGWTKSCRRISARFLVDILTREPWRKQVPYAGIHVIGARIVGDVDLHNAKLDRSLLIEQSRIENALNLDAARTDSVTSLVETRVAGSFSAEQFHSELSLFLGAAQFRQTASLKRAKVDGDVWVDGATFDEDLDADSIRVGGHLLMRSTDLHKASFKGVNLDNAKVTGQVSLEGATLEGDLSADSMQVGANLFMSSTDKHEATFKGVNLNNAKVAGKIYMEGTTFEGDLSADSMQVTTLLMRSTDAEQGQIQKSELEQR